MYFLAIGWIHQYVFCDGYRQYNFVWTPTLNKPQCQQMFWWYYDSLHPHTIHVCRLWLYTNVSSPIVGCSFTNTLFFGPRNITCTKNCFTILWVYGGCKDDLVRWVEVPKQHSFSHIRKIMMKNIFTILQILVICQQTPTMFSTMNTCQF